MTDATFAELQAKLPAFWPNVTLRSIGDRERTTVVVHSVTLDVPEQLYPVLPAYEERFLCLVLSLLHGPRSRVVYVTSQPIHPRVLDYYFSLVPELDTPEARSRFDAVSLVDGRNEPLAAKLLERPGAIRRIRALAGDPETAIILPFCVTDAEAELAVRARAADLRRRSGAELARDEDRQQARVRGGGRSAPGRPRGRRRGRRAAGAPRAPGRSRRARRAIVKLDDGVSGLGNAIVDLDAAEADLRGALELEDAEFERGRVHWRRSTATAVSSRS